MFKDIAVNNNNFQQNLISTYDKSQQITCSYINTALCSVTHYAQLPKNNNNFKHI